MSLKVSFIAQGIRQDNLLFPFLFILVMERLCSVLYMMEDKGVLARFHIPLSSGEY